MTRNVICKYSLLSFLVLGFISSNLLKKNPIYQPMKLNLQPILVVDDLHAANELKQNIKNINNESNFLIVKSNNKYNFIHSLQELALLNKGKNIEKSDPIYNNLYVGNYDKKNRNMRYLPINQSFIRAINLTPSFKVDAVKLAEVITPNHHQDKKNFHMVITDKLFYTSEINKIKYLL